VSQHQKYNNISFEQGNKRIPQGKNCPQISLIPTAKIKIRSLVKDNKLLSILIKKSCLLQQLFLIDIQLKNII
jgi:hypothetical protein